MLVVVAVVVVFAGREDLKIESEYIRDASETNTSRKITGITEVNSGKQ